MELINNSQNRCLFEPNTVIVATKNQRSSPLYDETIVVNLDNEEYYVLNKSASAIWAHLQQPVHWKNLSENASDADQAELKAFLLDLACAGLLIAADCPAIAREINFSVSTQPVLTNMGGLKELVAAAGSAGGGGDSADYGDDYDDPGYAD